MSIHSEQVKGYLLTKQTDVEKFFDYNTKRELIY